MVADRSTEWRPQWSVPPGEILLEVLQERGMTQSELARRLGRPIKTINEIIHAKAALTPETAIQLERALGISARFWTNLEGNYREALARAASLQDLEKDVSRLDSFPVKQLVLYGKLRSGQPKPELLDDLLAFFGVGNWSAWESTWLEPAAKFRGSSHADFLTESIAVWLRWGEVEGSKVPAEDFDDEKLRTSLREIRHLTTVDPVPAALERSKQLCAMAGVALVLIPDIQGAPFSGAARWLSRNRALIQLSLRHKTDDQLWFSLFHEAGHLLTSKQRDFLDVDVDAQEVTKDEALADSFARDELIPSTEYDDFVSERAFTTESVRMFAQSLGIASGIVVGRLQRDQYVGYERLNHLKKKIRWLTA